MTSTSAGLPALEVGDPANSNATGTVKITGGAKLELTGASGNASVGVASGSSGEIDVSGAGSKLMLDGNASTLTVGDNGTGVLNITGGAVVDDNAALVGVHSNLGNAGYVTVDGASSLWTNRDHVSIGTAGAGLIPLSILTLANGGTTTVTGQLLLNQHGQISGNGFINAGTFVTSGLIRPGAQIGSFYQAGALHITATTTQINSGGMRVTLAGTNAATTYDQILFTGTTAINGSLTVELANSFVPLLGNSFHILDLGSTSGTFSSVNLPSLSPGLAWNSSQLYTNGILSVVSASVSGDYNSNGTVDAADYVIWRKYNGTTHTLPHDPTGGTIGMTQYNTWRANFGKPPGSGLGVTVSVAVPEQSTMVMLVLAVAGVCSRPYRAA